MAAFQRLLVYVCVFFVVYCDVRGVNALNPT